MFSACRTRDFIILVVEIFEIKGKKSFGIIENWQENSQLYFIGSIHFHYFFNKKTTPKDYLKFFSQKTKHHNFTTFFGTLED